MVKNVLVSLLPAPCSWLFFFLKPEHKLRLPGVAEFLADEALHERGVVPQLVEVFLLLGQFRLGLGEPTLVRGFLACSAVMSRCICTKKLPAHSVTATNAAPKKPRISLLEFTKGKPLS